MSVVENGLSFLYCFPHFYSIIDVSDYCDIISNDRELGKYVPKCKLRKNGTRDDVLRGTMRTSDVTSRYEKRAVVGLRGAMLNARLMWVEIERKGNGYEIQTGNFR
ncbi:hypothetical protein HHI36_019404 [Cryptolaemus montrouzieri]|uniref:Uncharacterized protein n=1 Tax=Cryptolaemus montrouzieri TaxID=559131 RepID=A0ABD2P3L9_9CUCU